jgi:hypothetical protein
LALVEVALLLIDLTHKYYEKKTVLILKEETCWDLARTIWQEEKREYTTH